MFGKRSSFFLLFFVCVLLFLPICASEEVLSGEWIVTLSRVDFAQEEIPDGIECISFPHGIFLVREPDVLKTLLAGGNVLYYEKDTPVCLGGFEEEISSASNACLTGAMVGYSYAEKRLIDGKGVRIGIVDSGIAPAYPVWTDALVLQGTNYTVGEESEGRNDTTDTYGHGTAVASIIVGREIGLAPGATIVPIKAFDEKNSSAGNVVASIFGAVDDWECDILNLSFATAEYSRAMRDAIAYAVQKGVTVVASAGNDGKEAYMYPSRFDGVLSVGAVDANGDVCSFSNRNDRIFLVSLGTGVPAFGTNGEKIQKAGTSFAAPAVSAACALLKSVDPDISASCLQSILKESATKLGEEEKSITYGYGLLHIGLALAVLLEDTESLIPSVLGDDILLCGLSSLETRIQILACYDVNGKMLTALPGQTEEPSDRIFRSVLPHIDNAVIGSIGLFSVDPDSFVPLARKRTN